MTLKYRNELILELQYLCILWLPVTGLPGDDCSVLVEMVVLVVEVGWRTTRVDVWIVNTDRVVMRPDSPVDITVDVIVTRGGLLSVEMVVLVVEVGRRTTRVDVWIVNTDRVVMRPDSPVDITVDVIVTGGGLLLVVDIIS